VLLVKEQIVILTKGDILKQDHFDLINFFLLILEGLCFLTHYTCYFIIDGFTVLLKCRIYRRMSMRVHLNSVFLNSSPMF